MSPNSYATYFGNFTLVLWFINIIPECNLFFKYLLYVMFDGIYEVSINETYRRMIRIKILTIRMLYLYKGTGNRK